jgi:hypothetical protein
VVDFGQPWGMKTLFLTFLVSSSALASCPDLRGRWGTCRGGNEQWPVDLVASMSAGETGPVYHISTTDFRNGRTTQLEFKTDPAGIVRDEPYAGTNIIKRTIIRYYCQNNSLVQYERVLAQTEGSPSWTLQSHLEVRYSMGRQGEFIMAIDRQNGRPTVTTCF